MRNYFQSAMTDPQTQRPGSDRVGASTDTNTAPSVAAHVPTGSVEDLANYLTDGYWADNGGARHTFDTSTSNIITVNITGLTADGQRLARWAMEAWESVADIQFAEISGPAQITFTDNQPGAYSSYYAFGGTTQSAVINVSASWLNAWGTQIDDYPFSTYLHELGHALGLGHQGNYNGAATYGVDETFANDSYQVSLMSYFSQTENTTVNASYGLPATAMIADIMAIQALYGAPSGSSATAGNTIYGVGQTIGGYFGTLLEAMFAGNDPLNYYGDAPVAMTLYDQGGTDTVDLSTDTNDQTIDLNGGGVWNVGGRIGNIVVSTGTVLESYIAGSGNDLVIGNGAANMLAGSDGADTLIGGGGNDFLNGEATDWIFDPIAAQVFRLYQATLDRAPDLGGLMGWTGHIQGGLSLDEAAARFVGSAEFQARYGATTNSEFVTLLYNNVLNRAPDATGYANWVNQLNSGNMSRAEVVNSFAQSTEFQNNTAVDALSFSRAGLQADWSDDVFRLYNATLDRNPDVDGFGDWTSRLAEGREYLDVVTGFVNSAEFQARYGTTTNGEFVTLLYNNVLNRAPDATGYATWVNQLNSGNKSRAEVVQGFAQSAEFRADTADALEAWMRGQGGDRLAGGSGDNILFGGIGADTFVFDTTDGGTQVIADMEAWDTVEIDNSSYANVNSLIASLTQDGGDVVLNDNGTTIRFEDTNISQFDTDMFVFV